MKTLVQYFLDNRVVTLVLTLVLVGTGIMAFSSMSRLEDPEFTIKDALVITPYPGASPMEVEQEVSNLIEQAAQSLGQLDSVSSRSEAGLSTVTVTIQDKYNKDTLPQVWDELRRKIDDVQAQLPPGAGPSRVVDDYGDVYGMFFVVYGEEYSYAELWKVVDMLKRELLLVDDVAKIDTMGQLSEVVFVEPDRARMTQLGIPREAILNELQSANLVQAAGRARVGRDFITLRPTGEAQTVEEIGDIRLSVGDRQIQLRDIATIRRGYQDPPTAIVKYNGQPGIAMGISTRSGGNVVEMGEALKARAQDLIFEVPDGVEFGFVSVQSEAVVAAIDNFVLSLIQAVVIVIFVLLLFMGLRSGLLIGAILMITILGSFTFLKPMEVALERISLGALIIALGMLVDNAIVVIDGMLTRIQKGEQPRDAAIRVVSQTAIPLLGATAIAILAFAAIGTSPDSTGEFCRSLFQVILVSLSLSWVTAVTVTPLLGVIFLKPPKKKAGEEDKPVDPYGGRFYRTYRTFLSGCLRWRWVTMAVVLATFVVSVWAFGFVKSAFFPPSTRPQFMVDLWLPQGSHIESTEAASKLIEARLMEEEGVTGVTTLIGRGGLRFLLTYGAERPNPAYAHFLVDVEDASRIDGLIRKIDREYELLVPDTQIYGYKFELGPGSKGKLEARFLGEDPDVLRQLNEQAREVFEADPGIKAVVNTWRQRVKIIRPVILQEQASFLGLTRADIAQALMENFQGSRIGVYRDGDLLLPILMRNPEPRRSDIADLANIFVWSPVANRSVSLTQVVMEVETSFEDEIILREDRRRTQSIKGDPIDETASEVLARIRPAIEAIEVPPGYRFEWGGEYEDSGEAQASLAASIPMFIGAMIVVTICLFNSLRQPLVIWLCVPLIIIGVSAGLLLTNQAFNFMAILGFLSLVGMMIKNAIVLVDEINDQGRQLEDPLEVILNSGVSRLRPVAMAAGTTALGMLPLLMDAFFVAMAVTIIFGLVVGSVLTMIVLPVLYSIIFGIRVK